MRCRPVIGFRSRDSGLLWVEAVAVAVKCTAWAFSLRVGRGNLSVDSQLLAEMGADSWLQGLRKPHRGAGLYSCPHGQQLVLVLGVYERASPVTPPRVHNIHQDDRLHCGSHRTRSHRGTAACSQCRVLAQS